MASEKSLKPPVKHNLNKSKLPKKPAVSLTNEQWNEIFDAVVDQSQKQLKLKSPLTADLPGNEAKSPTESAVVKAKSTTLLDRLFSSPHKIKTLKTNRKTVTNLQKSSKSDSKTELISSPPRKLTKRERLQWLQERRGTGMYVKCDDIKCAKWRWLDNPDPVDLPPNWFCHMNPDKALASCSVAEATIPSDVENDLVHNNFSPGSIVWAKMTGYPWWPAMVDDCPDCEQYYWINKHGGLVPDYYNVVFFDNTEVTRRWILVKNLKSYKHNPDFDKTFKLQLIYKKRMRLAKEKANSAISLRIIDRLKRHSFLALWDKEIPEFLTSSEDDDSDVDDSDIDYEKRIKRKIVQRIRAYYKSKEIINDKRNSVDRQDARLSQNKTICSVTPTKKLKQDTLLSSTDTKSIKPAKNVRKQSGNSSIKSVKETISSSKNTQKNNSNEDKTCLPQEKSKGKENLIIKDEPKNVVESKSKNNCTETIENSSNSESGQIFRPVDRILDNNRADFDRDLAQQAYDLCLNLFTSGKHGEAQFEKMYKKITMNNNNELLSQKNQTTEEPNKSTTESLKIAEEKKPDKKNQVEKYVSKIQSNQHESSQKQSQKRKIEESNLSKVVKVIKLAQKEFMTPKNDSNQNTSPFEVSPVSNFPKKIFQESGELTPPSQGNTLSPDP